MRKIALDAQAFPYEAEFLWNKDEKLIWSFYWLLTQSYSLCHARNLDSYLYYRNTAFLDSLLVNYPLSFFYSNLETTFHKQYQEKKDVGILHLWNSGLQKYRD